MSAIPVLIGAAVMIIIKIYFNSASTSNDTGTPLSANYWMVHDPKYNPYNT
jgi:hypothetical protein